MSRGNLKSRLANKELTIGSWLSFGSPFLAEMMARAGFDWLAVDMEHGLASMSEQAQLIQTIDLAGADPLVRVGANDPLLIKQAMDCGARGVIVPMICSPAEAIQARDALHYPPVGKRGVGLSRAQDYGMGFDRYRRWADENAVLIVMIEHIDAVQRIDDIVNVDYVDGFIVGPYDMSGSIGKPGEFDDPQVQELLDHVTDVIQRHRKPGGYHVVHSDHELMHRRIREGCRFMAYGTEMVFLAEKLGLEGEFTQALKREFGRD